MLQVAEAQARDSGPAPADAERMGGAATGAGPRAAADLQAKRDQPPGRRSRPWTAMRCAPPIPIAAGRGCSGSSARRPPVSTTRPGDRPWRGGADLHRRRPAPRCRRGRDPGERERERAAVRFSVAVAPGTFVRPAGPRLPPRLDRARRRHPARRAGAGPRRIAGPPLAARSASTPHRPARDRQRTALAGRDARGQPDLELQHRHARRRCSEPGVRGRSISASAPTRVQALAARVRDAAGLDLLVTTGGASVGRLRPCPAGARTRGHARWTSGRSRCGRASRSCSAASARCRSWAFRAIPSRRGSVRSCSCARHCRRCTGLPVGLRMRRAGLANGLAANDQRQDYLRGRLCRAGSEPATRDARASARTARCWPPSRTADALVVRAAVRSCARGWRHCDDHRPARGAGQPVVEDAHACVVVRHAAARMQPPDAARLDRRRRTKLEHLSTFALTILRCGEEGVLTQRQLQLLQFIQKFVRDHEVSPSFEEMRSALQAALQVGHPPADFRVWRSGATSVASPIAPERSRWSEPLAEGPVGTELDTTPFEPPSNVVRGAFRRNRPSSRPAPMRAAAIRCRCSAASRRVYRSRRWPTATP